MATARSRKYQSASDTVIHKLADLFRKNGHRAISGDSKVCFTSDSLNMLNSYFQAAKINILMPPIYDDSRTTSMLTVQPVPLTLNLTISATIREDLIFIRDFLQTIKSVKLIHNTPTLQGNVFLNPFLAVTCLELKRISPHMVIGLAPLRRQLETLICSQSQSITEIGILTRNSDDNTIQNQEWPHLKSLFLTHNMIEHIDESLKCFVALEILDLSHNRLRDCSKILEYLPHIQHLNLSSNNIRTVPVRASSNSSCRLVTLKMRQNSIDKLDGVEHLSKLEELDLTDNFIITVPRQIRQLSKIKRLLFSRNPFTYDSNYRQELIRYLPYQVPDDSRELVIDEQPLTLREKQSIPRSTTNQQPLVPNYITTPVSSLPNTSTSDSTESDLMTGSSGTTVVTRRRPRRKNRDGRVRTGDVGNGMMTEQNNSGNEIMVSRERLIKISERFQEDDDSDSKLNNNLDTNYLPTIIDQEDTTIIKHLSPVQIVGSLPRKTINDVPQSQKRRRSPFARKADPPTKLTLEVVDIPSVTSDSTSVPGSPQSDKEHILDDSLPRQRPPSPPLPVASLEPKPSIIHEQQTGDDIRTKFIVTIPTSDDSITQKVCLVEIDRMYLIERDNNDKTLVENIKYSTMKLLSDDNSDPNTVEFTFERRRNDIVKRLYLFDTKLDQMAFVDEVKRHIEVKTPIETEPAPLFTIQCNTCGKFFQVSSMVKNDANAISQICLNCQTIALLKNMELNNETQLKPAVDVFTDEYEIDHRLHLQLAADHFTDDHEKIELKFKCFAMCSTTNKYFICQTIVTNFGVYIFEQESPYDEETKEFMLVGKDTLNKVLLLDIGYRLQTFTIELQSAAFTFLLADQQKTQRITNHVLQVLLPIVQSGEGELQKISRISSDEYRQRLFGIIRAECAIDEPHDDMIDFYSIMIRMDRNGNNQMIALLLLQNWILMIEDAYATINSRHVRLPAQSVSDSPSHRQQLKCDLMHLVNVTTFNNSPKILVFDFVDETETIQLQWRLESLTNDSKNEFLKKTRDTYKTLMGIPMPEKMEMA